jgi:hypothetical protein
MLPVFAARPYPGNPVDVLAALAFLLFCGIDKPEITSSRLVALFVVIADGFMMYVRGVPPVGFLLIPLGLIWFSELLGSAHGKMGHGVIESNSPGWMVAGFGWIFLLAVTIAVAHDYLQIPGTS